MRLELGDDATRQWLEGIADNDAFTFANNNAIVAAVGRGEIDVGLVNHYYVYQALAQDPGFAARNHDLAARRHRQPGHRHRGVGARSAPTTTTRRSSSSASCCGEEAQRYFSEQTFEYPLAAGVEPADVLPPVEFVRREGIDLDQLGGDLESTREMIRDAGLEG